MKTIEEQEKDQVKALDVLEPEENKEETNSVEGLFPKEMTMKEIKKEIDEIKKWEQKVRRKHYVYKTNKYKYGFYTKNSQTKSH